MINFKDSFKMPYDCLIEDTKGDFRIEKFSIDPEKDWRAYLSGIPVGNYIKLSHRGEVVMSNTPMEMRTCNHIMSYGYGDVLVGGLGIGCILGYLDSNPDVKCVLVIEKFKEVIELNKLENRFSDKIKVIQGDIWDWKPDKGVKFDCIWLDIWNYVNSDVYEEMKSIKSIYRKYLKPKSDSQNRFIKCWGEYQARYNYPLY